MKKTAAPVQAARQFLLPAILAAIAFPRSRSNPRLVTICLMEWLEGWLLSKSFLPGTAPPAGQTGSLTWMARGWRGNGTTQSGGSGLTVPRPVMDNKGDNIHGLRYGPITLKISLNSAYRSVFRRRRKGVGYQHERLSHAAPVSGKAEGEV